MNGTRTRDLLRDLAGGSQAHALLWHRGNRPCASEPRRRQSLQGTDRALGGLGRCDLGNPSRTAGFPDGVIRTVSENSKVLKVKGGFEAG